MRIKYRAWHKAEKKMYQVVDMYFGKSGELQTVRLLAEHDNMQYPTNDISIDEVELIQYTGLKDKDGVEIYKGDIVKRKSLVLGSIDITGIVKMLEGCWVIDDGHDAVKLWTECDENEVCCRYSLALEYSKEET